RRGTGTGCGGPGPTRTRTPGSGRTGANAPRWPTRSGPRPGRRDSSRSSDRAASARADEDRLTGLVGRGEGDERDAEAGTGRDPGEQGHRADPVGEVATEEHLADRRPPAADVDPAA